MKNVDCSRLGTILQLDTQKGKEAMKTSNFQKDIGETAACMKRLIVATKGCEQLISNETYFSDSYFSGVKTAEEAMTKGVDYCGLTKTIHKGYCIATLEKLMKYWLGGSYIAMKNTPIVPGGRPIMAVRYK